MRRLTLSLLACLLLVVLVMPASAIHKCISRCVVCPQCHTCCEFKAEAAKEEKHCWKIECEEICVPCIVFPWQKRHATSCKTGRCDGKCACSPSGICASGSCNKCCQTVNNGARVITVRKLKKHKYECPTCKYQWTPKKVCRAGCQRHCRGDCACADPGESWADDSTVDLPEIPESEAPR